MKNETEQILDDLCAKETFCTERYVPLVAELDRQAALPEQERTLLGNIAFMAAIEQMVLLGLLSPDAVAVREVGKGSFATVFALLIERRSIALKVLQQARHAEILPAPDAGCSDASMFCEVHSDAQRFAALFASQDSPFRRNARMWLAQEHDVLRRLPGYLPGRRLSANLPTALLMRHIDGCNLQDLLQELSREPAHEDALALALVHSVATAQAQSGHLHLDIKPANVMVNTDGDVVLVDWALSRPLPADGGQIHTENAIGTPGYMAPEQMRGVILQASPVFQVGSVLFELWTRVQFVSEHMHEAGQSSTNPTDIFRMMLAPQYAQRTEAILNRRFPAESGLAWRADVLRSMLDADPARRTSLGAVADLLALCCDGRCSAIAESVRSRVLRMLPQVPQDVSAFTGLGTIPLLDESLGGGLEEH